MVSLQNRKIEASAILAHWKVYLIFLVVLPFKFQSFAFSQTGEQQQIIELGVNEIAQTINGFSPLYQILNRPTIGLLLIPLDRCCQAFGQIMCAACIQNSYFWGPVRIHLLGVVLERGHCLGGKGR